MSEPSNLPPGVRVRLKSIGYCGTITGRTGPWYHITFDNGDKPHTCNYYGDYEFDVLPLPTVLVPCGYDETHAECVQRAQRSHELRPGQPDPDAHVTAWRIAMRDMIEEIAWLRRQEKAITDGH